jgi:hypothetical protein
MKIEVEKIEPAFKPFMFTITIESRDELIVLKQIHALHVTIPCEMFSLTDKIIAKDYLDMVYNKLENIL